MVKRKTAMHAGKKQEKIKTQRIIVVEGAIDSHESTLEEISKNTETALEFSPPVNIFNATTKLDLYNERRVYAMEHKPSQDNKRKLPVYYHGTLDTDCTLNSPLYYGIRPIRNPSFLDFHEISELRKIIVMK